MDGIVIRGVSKVYGDSVMALDGLDLDIDPGELLVVVGPSGSGKTTLLRLMAGLDRPTAGTICLGCRDGVCRDVAGVPPQRRDVALVFQSLALYGHLTVEQNLAFALNAQTTGGWFAALVRRGPANADVRERVAEAARLLRIEHLLDRRPAELSGGEQQRVALGRAIVRRPKALLLDEPLSSLDLPMRRELRRELKELQRKLAVPTVYVTHDQAEALAMGDRIAVLNQGRLAQVGTPSEIYERPRTRFVAEFFGMHGMNWIEGELIEKLKLRPPRENANGAVAGIRPEHVAMSTSQGCCGEVTAMENLGDATYVRVRVSGADLTIRLSNNATQTPTIGDRIGFELQPDRVHWFDARGNRLTSNN